MPVPMVQKCIEVGILHGTRWLGAGVNRVRLRADRHLFDCH
eukprot:COSAG02_NODE_46736_length_346_cov_1.072874_1_plen_40_part_10